MSQLKDRYRHHAAKRKCSSSSFLPRTLSTFQQARRRDLHRTVLLARTAIFEHEEDDGLCGRSAKPRQAKVLTGGGDLREAQVDVPLSVSHSCV